MHAGTVSQIGTPDEIYEKPNSIRVADFIGQANFLECTVNKQEKHSLLLIFPSNEEISLDSRSNKFSGFSNPRGVLFVRPERIKIKPASGGPNRLNGKVKRILYLGSVVRYFVEVFPRVTPQEVLVDENRRIEGVDEGDAVALVFKEEDVGLFAPDQKKRL